MLALASCSAVVSAAFVAGKILMKDKMLTNSAFGFIVAHVLSRCGRKEQFGILQHALI